MQADALQGDALPADALPADALPAGALQADALQADPLQADARGALDAPGMLDYVAVGHVTADLIADAPGGPRRQPGGGAFYSALQAARLGLRSAIVTCGQPQELAALLGPYSDELTLHVLPAAQTTTLHTEGSGSARRQRLLAWAGPIPRLELSLRAGILHLAPIARELTGDCGVAADFVGLTPQGLVRSWTAIGAELAPDQLDPSALPARCDAVVLSEAELACCEALLSGKAPSNQAGPSGATPSAPQPPPSAKRPIVAITAGPGPTTVQLPDGATVSVAPPPLPVAQDDLGAGDVFAAAFFVALQGGQTPRRAAELGNAAAAVRIAGAGPDAIGDRAAIAAAVAADES